MYIIPPAIVETPNNYSNYVALTKQLNNNLVTDYGLNYNEILEDEYIVQSITEIDNNLVISAYKKNKNSRIYFYSQEDHILKGGIILDTKAHVGGITFDNSRDILFITNTRGKIFTYNYKVIRELIKNSNDFQLDLNKLKKEYPSIIIKNSINMRKIDSKAESSSVYYYNNNIYIASFNPIGKSSLYKFNIDYNHDTNEVFITNNKVNKYRISSRIQGISISKYNNKEYLICSQSLGKTKSSILIYEIDDKGSNLIDRIYIKDYGLEGLTIDNNNNLLGVFENNNRPLLVLKLSSILHNDNNEEIAINPSNEIVSYLGGIAYKIFK